MEGQSAVVPSQQEQESDVCPPDQWYDPSRAECVPSDFGTLGCNSNQTADPKYGVCVDIPTCVSGQPPVLHDEWPLPQTHPIYYTCDSQGESPICVSPLVLSPDRRSCITVVPVEPTPSPAPSPDPSPAPEPIRQVQRPSPEPSPEPSGGVPVPSGSFPSVETFIVP